MNAELLKHESYVVLQLQFWVEHRGMRLRYAGPDQFLKTCPSEVAVAGSNRLTYLEFRWIGTNEFLDFLPILEDDKRRHLI